MPARVEEEGRRRIPYRTFRTRISTHGTWPSPEAECHRPESAESHRGHFHVLARASHRPSRPLDSPAGKDTGERDNILLGVAAIDAERMEFHQFARVVFVKAVLFAASAGTIGRGVQPIVEIIEHCGMLRGRFEQV